MTGSCWCVSGVFSDCVQLKSNLMSHTARAMAVSWSPDSKLMVSGGIDTNLCVWDAVKGNKIQVIKGMVLSFGARIIVSSYLSLSLILSLSPSLSSFPPLPPHHSHSCPPPISHHWCVLDQQHHLRLLRPRLLHPYLGVHPLRVLGHPPEALNIILLPGISH